MKRKRSEEVEEEVAKIEPAIKKLKTDTASSLVTQAPVAKTMKKCQKKRVAFVISYIGTKYFGSQYQTNNPVKNTVEECLFGAIHDAKGMSRINFLGGPKKIGWNRCSRTDKGVHALFNVISGKLILRERIVEEINKFLPEDICLHGIHRVTNHFVPKKSCSRRYYEYIIPSFMFAKNDKILSLEIPKKMKKAERIDFIEKNWNLVDENYRLSEENFKKINSLFSNFVGTRFYKNFTKVTKETNRRSLNRYITQCEISKPYQINTTEFVTVKITGQSFVMHQIRKMIGLVATIMLGVYEGKIFDVVFEDNQNVVIPKAPGLGLYLRNICFGSYNESKGKIHGPLEYDVFKESIERFEEKLKIHICEEEKSENVYKKWIISGFLTKKVEFL